MKNVRIYWLGEYYEDTIAIPCKEVADIDEAREIVLSMRKKWQEEFTDEEYLKIFGKEKVRIEGEFKSFIRHIGVWSEPSYEYHEQDWCMMWKPSTKGGRGAIECYCFDLESTYGEYFKYEEMKEKENEKEKSNVR